MNPILSVFLKDFLIVSDEVVDGLYAGAEVNQAFQQGFEAGGRILGQGSLVLGRYGRTISEAPYDSGNSQVRLTLPKHVPVEEFRVPQHLRPPEAVGGHKARPPFLLKIVLLRAVFNKYGRRQSIPFH